ncbi:hypothetical protein M3P05_01570 [Sansalvadorimonas sp. 2012CJ34-2]|uniref:TRAF-type domain-containing protein n=1 Tax=Parendozoicomonas callyspongiae TaxID=2942213 RepID=A0ABT0PD18_9GAMM|nr:hypothetical protein [Sansalvadorimonas sp. 2012CJ34-2]MCL6268642.1 hypothetical protein [Sansalvadorimonas sp. 2012CJ34-2]
MPDALFLGCCFRAGYGSFNGKFNCKSCAQPVANVFDQFSVPEVNEGNIGAWGMITGQVKYILVDEYKTKLGKLVVHCAYEGCEWNIEYGAGGEGKQGWQEHSNTCEFAPLNCKQCNASLLRKHMQSHLGEICPEQDIQCSDCGACFKAKQLQSHNINVCSPELFRKLVLPLSMMMLHL